jgi:hypothetical protein
MPQDSALNLEPFLEKARIFSEKYLMCCKYIHTVAPSRETLTKKFYVEAMSSAQLLEDFLDFHGAKENRGWYYYRELSAAVRHLSSAANAQKHIFNRFPHYGLDDLEDFQTQGQRTHDYLASVLKRFSPVIMEEARRLSIRVPRKSFKPEDFPRISTRSALPADIDGQEKSEDKRNIVKVTGNFLGVVDSFDEIGIFQKMTAEEIGNLVPEHVNEVEVKRYAMLVHGLQSTFDSYIIRGATKDPRKLRKFRGYFSMVLHLLELTGSLLHFHERHLRDMGIKDVHKRVRERLAEIINPEMLLDRTINYGLYYASIYLKDGQKLAEEIRDEHMVLDRITVSVPVERGFHTRPSLLVARIVERHGGKVRMLVGDQSFDASRPIMLQYGGGEVKRLNLAEVVFEGNSLALADIRTLAGVNYGEDQIGRDIPLPRELSYLLGR